MKRKKAVPAPEHHPARIDAMTERMIIKGESWEAARKRAVVKLDAQDRWTGERFHAQESIEDLAERIARPGEDWESTRQRAIVMLDVSLRNPEQDPLGVEALASQIAYPGESWDSASQRASQLMAEPTMPEPVAVQSGRVPVPEKGSRPAHDTQPCYACGEMSVPHGMFCPECYGYHLGEEDEPALRKPIWPGRPGDPWAEFNAEADAYDLDMRMPERLRQKRPATKPQQASSE